MKGATHNLIVRTRINVALYVLNQKRGHLRSLEHSFKVGLSVVADPSLAGQQSFVIDRGEQVHTLEAAKALLATQLATYPPQAEEVHEDEPPLDTETEIEADDAETHADEQAGGQPEGDGRKRKRRRPRRERSGETSDNQTSQAVEVPDSVQIAADFAAARFMIDDFENEGEDSPVQDGEVRAEQSPDGDERRPRRRGRRGGRRRRGSNGASAVDSISDELNPASASDAATEFEAVADLDSVSIAPETQNGSCESETQPQQPPAEPTPPPAEARNETVSKSEKAVRRRSTVREKVSFASQEPPAAPVTQSEPEAATPQTQEPPPQVSDETQPRRAGWWSRRFGDGT